MTAQMNKLRRVALREGEGELRVLKEPEKPEEYSQEFAELADTQPTVALISPNYAYFRSLKRALESQRANILVEMTAYPSMAHLPRLLEADCDAFLIEIDSDPEMALDVVETISSRRPGATIMVYAGVHSPETMVKSMRAGAREFLSGNFVPEAMQEALVRAAARRAEQSVKRVNGKVFVFWGAKGGCGVTTLAANLAIGLRMESGAEVALLDLNPRLGDVAVLLGMRPKFTLAEALQNGRKLDQELIGTLMTSHSSGVAVLAAPDEYKPSLEVDPRSIGRLVDVVRSQYPYVVVDAGRDLGNGAEPLFQMADCTYIVTEVDIPSLRNAQRFLAHLKSSKGTTVEVVINRYDARRTEIDEDRIGKTLGVKPKWRVPNDFAAVNRCGNSGHPLVNEKSPAASAVKAMARSASGKTAAADTQKRGWSLFG